MDDRISGSTSLLISFINMALANLQEKKWDAKQFREYLAEFSESFIDMQTIQVFARAIETSIDDKITSFLENKLETIDKQTQIIFNSFLASIERKFKDQDLQFLTISNSYTIFSLLSKLHRDTNISFTVYVLESLPGGEGKKLHADLVNHDVNASIIADDIFYNKSDFTQFSFFICGSDAYTDSGFINKIGTSKLIALGLERGIEVLVLTNKSKKTEKPLINPVSGLLEYCTKRANVTYLGSNC